MEARIPVAVSAAVDNVREIGASIAAVTPEAVIEAASRLMLIPGAGALTVSGMAAAVIEAVKRLRVIGASMLAGMGVPVSMAVSSPIRDG